MHALFSLIFSTLFTCSAIYYLTNWEGFQNEGDQKKKAESVAEDQEEQRFVRIVRDEKGKPLAMETAIVRYVPKDDPDSGLIVDMIGAVHVGEKQYYESLQKEFENYDAMLYELVAPKGTKIVKGEKRGGSVLSSMQIMLKDMLDLEFQLEQIDYETKNFVHADMTPEEFSKSMENLGESPISMFLKLMQASAAQQAKRGRKGQMDDFALMAALLSGKSGAPLVRRYMAEQLDGADTMLEALNGPKGSTLVSERNKVALKVLRTEIDSGKKKLAIFYGAAHLPDFEKRLINDFGLKRAEVRWLKAWDLKVPERKPAKSPTNEPEKVPEKKQADTPTKTAA